MKFRLLYVSMCCLALGLAACGGGIKGVADNGGEPGDDGDNGDPGGGGGASQAELKAAQDALKAAQDSLRGAQARVTMLTADLATATGNVTTLTRARDAARADVTRLTGELKTATDRAAALTTQLATATGNVTTLTRARDAARADVTRLTGELATATGNVTRLTGELATATGNVTRLTADLATANASVTTLTAQLGSANAEVDRRSVTFGEAIVTPAAGPAGAQVERTARQGSSVELQFNEGFDPKAGAAFTDRLRYVASGGDTYTGMTVPDTVLYDADGEDVKPILGMEDEVADVPFPGRGFVLRSGLRAVLAGPPATGTTLASAQQGYGVSNRLIIQGERLATDRTSGDAARDLVRGGTDDDDTRWRAWDAKWQASFRFDPEGGADEDGSFIMRFGGAAPESTVGASPTAAQIADAGALVFPDLEMYPAKRGDGATSATHAALTADNRTSADIAIHFGEPSPDPLGERAYYWRLEVESGLADLDRHPAGHANAGDPITANTAPGNHPWHTASGAVRVPPQYVTVADDPLDEPGGYYEAVLSNHAGDDDEGEPRYMDYAAYGLFRYMDQGLGYRGAVANNFYNEYEDAPNRIQAFHYGFDAFGTGGATIGATDAQQIEATFNGKTSGWFLFPEWDDNTRDINQLANCGTGYNTACATNYIGDMLRMRGDVMLRACIGGTSDCAFGTEDDVAANEIDGEIDGLEYSLGEGAGWTNRSSARFANTESRIHGTFHLSGEIDTADGSFGRTTTAAVSTDGTAETVIAGTGTNAMWNVWLGAAGGLEGAFYGPIDALEAAGAWYAQTSQGQADLAGVVGSFGAVCTDGCGDE